MFMSFVNWQVALVVRFNVFHLSQSFSRRIDAKLVWDQFCGGSIRVAGWELELLSKGEGRVDSKHVMNDADVFRVFIYFKLVLASIATS